MCVRPCRTQYASFTAIMIHLDREPHVGRRVPDGVVDAGIDGERLGLLRAVDVVDARAVNRAEVGGDVVVAEVAAPRLDLCLQPLDRRPVRRHLEDRCGGQRRVVHVELHDPTATFFWEG